MGKYRLLLFLAICQILKVYGTLKISYLSYIAIIHNAMLILSGKKSSRTSRPLCLLFRRHMAYPTSNVLSKEQQVIFARDTERLCNTQIY